MTAIMRWLRSWLLPATMFLIMVAYLPGVMSPSTVGRWAVITLVGLPALLTARPGRWGLGLLWLGWAAASWLWSVSPLDTVGALLHWLALSGIAVLAYREQNIERVWLAVALGVLVSLPFLVAQLVGFEPVWSATQVGYSGNTGLFLTSNVFAEVSLVAAIFALSQQRWLLAGLLLTAAALSGRAEALFMLGTAGTVAFLDGKRLKIWIVLVTLLAFVALIIVFRGHGYFGQEFRSQWQRIEIWTITIQGFSFLGTGFGTYREMLPSFGFAHNEALQLIYELGIGSLLIFGVLGYAITTSGSIVARSALSALLASALVWAPFQDPATAAIVCALVGHLLRVRRFACLSKYCSGPVDSPRALPGWVVSPTALQQPLGCDRPLAL